MTGQWMKSLMDRQLMMTDLLSRPRQKPHLKRSSGMWVCEGGGVKSLGYFPEYAYEKWDAILRGRNLRNYLMAKLTTDNRK